MAQKRRTNDSCCRKVIMKELLTYILKGITGVDIAVEEKEENDMTIFTVFAPKEVIGRIIGKNGKSIHAIKTVLKIRAMKEDRKIDIVVQEE